MDTVHNRFPNFGFQFSGTQNSKKKKNPVDLGVTRSVKIFVSRHNPMDIDSCRTT